MTPDRGSRPSYTSRPGGPKRASSGGIKGALAALGVAAIAGLFAASGRISPAPPAVAAPELPAEVLAARPPQEAPAPPDSRPAPAPVQTPAAATASSGPRVIQTPSLPAAAAPVGTVNFHFQFPWGYWNDAVDVTLDGKHLGKIPIHFSGGDVRALVDLPVAGAETPHRLVLISLREWENMDRYYARAFTYDPRTRQWSLTRTEKGFRPPDKNRFRSRDTYFIDEFDPVATGSGQDPFTRARRSAGFR